MFGSKRRAREQAERERLAREQAAKEAAEKAAAEEAARQSLLKKETGRLKNSKAFRVFQLFSNREGQLLASGLSYQAIFALFAGIWFAFSVLGLVFSGNKTLQDGLVSGVNAVVPGLIGGKSAAVPVDTLLNTGVLGWSGAVSLLLILFTTIGFVSTLRGALLFMFDKPKPTRNIVVQRLMDLGLVIVFGVLLLVTAGVSVVTAAASQFVFKFLGLPTDNWFTYAVSGLIGLIVVALLDMVLLIGVMRVVAGVKLPHKQLWRTALTGGIVLGFLQTLGSGLLGAPKNNPLFASFAVIFGLLVYFNFVCEVILFCAAWLKTGLQDADGKAQADKI